VKDPAFEACPAKDRTSRAAAAAVTYVRGGKSLCVHTAGAQDWVQSQLHCRLVVVAIYRCGLQKQASQEGGKQEPAENNI
jgi:hypothetical protein